MHPGVADSHSTRLLRQSLSLQSDADRVTALTAGLVTCGSRNCNRPGCRLQLAVLLKQPLGPSFDENFHGMRGTAVLYTCTYTTGGRNFKDSHVGFRLR